MVDDIQAFDGIRTRFPLGPGMPAPVRPPGDGTGGKAGPTGGSGGFAGILREKLAVPPHGPHKLEFSRHARERLAEAGRTMTGGELQAMEEAVAKAAAKGARESLVLMTDLALVVSVRNSTVITAVPGARMKEQVFTNIDSAVIVRD